MISRRGLAVALFIATWVPALGQEPQPAITEHMIVRAIASDLVYNSPQLSIELTGAKPSSAVDNLLRAGLVRVLGTTRNGGLRPAGRLILKLTASGQQVAAKRGWAVGGGMITIPTGRLVYVRNSYKMEQKGKTASVTFEWRYEANSNMRYLLHLGAPSSWPKTMYPDCLSTLGVAPAKAVSRTITIVTDGSGNWSNLEQAVYPIAGCKVPR